MRGNLEKVHPRAGRNDVLVKASSGVTDSDSNLHHLSLEVLTANMCKYVFVDAGKT